MPQKRKSKRTHKSKKLSRQKVSNLILSFLVITLMITIASYFILPTNSTPEEKNTYIVSEIEKNYIEYNKKQKVMLDKSEETIESQKSNTFKDYTKEFEKDYANVQEIKKDIIEIIQSSKKIEKTVVENIEVIEKTVSNQIEKITQEIIHKIEVIKNHINNKTKHDIIIDDVN